MPKKSKKGGNAHKKSKNTQKKKERNWTYDELMELGGGFAVVTGLSGGTRCKLRPILSTREEQSYEASKRVFGPINYAYRNTSTGKTIVAFTRELKKVCIVDYIAPNEYSDFPVLVAYLASIKTSGNDSGDMCEPLIYFGEEGAKDVIDNDNI